MKRTLHSILPAFALAASLVAGGAAHAAQGAAGFPRSAEGGLVTTPLASAPGGEEGVRFYFGATGYLNCVAATGRPCQGFPVFLGDKVQIVGAPATGDLDGDGSHEVAVAVSDGSVAVFRADGLPMDGFSFQSKALFETGPAFTDLDRDGKADLLVGAKDGKLHALTASGAELPKFPLGFAQSVTSPASAGLLGQAAAMAVVVGNEDGRVYAVEVTGKQLPGFPLASQYLVSGQPSIADLDGDGYNDVAFASQDFKLYAVHHDGRPFPNFPVGTGGRNLAGPAIGDVDGNGKLDLVAGSFDGKVNAFDLNGRQLPGFPVKVGDRVVGATLLADVDRDGKDEILAATSDGQLHLLRSNGKPHPGFPAKIGAEPLSGPVVADSPDAATIVVVAAGERLFGYKVKRTGKAAEPFAWPEAGHDGSHSGRRHPNPPGYAELRVAPPKPTTEDVLKAEYRFYDLDGDAEPPPDIKWFRDGKEVPELAGKREVPADQTRKKERWRFEISAPGTPVKSSPEVQVLNTPPGRPKLELEPAVLRRAEALKVKVVSPAPDPDGDGITYRYAWQRGGQPQKGLTAPELPANIIKRGEHWSVVVTATDGESDGPAMIVEGIVEDSPPSTPEIALAPAAPRIGDKVTVSIKKDAVDADGDPLRYEYRFFVDGALAPVSNGTPVLPALVARKKQVVSVEVRADDGEVLGQQATAQVTLVNTPPTAPEPTIFPAQPRRGDVVVAGLAKASHDADGDKLTYRFTFTCGGKKVAAADGRALSGLKKGDSCELEAVAHDGETDSPAGRLKFTVANTPPSAPSIAFESLPLRRSQPVKVKVAEAANDPDGDKLSYSWTWTKNGQVQKGFTGPELPAGTIRKGERWIVSAEASDGQASGPAASLEAEVAGSAPTAPEVALTPADPSAGDAIKAVVKAEATDPDGDKLSYRYRFSIDGVPVAQERDLASLPPRAAQRKQVVSVEVQAFDGELAGPAAAAKVTVRNTAPSAPAVALIPAEPRNGDVLEASLTSPGSDDDGDALTYRYTFLKDGKKLSASGDGRYVGGAKKGETYEVEVVASDGEADSEPARAKVTVKNSAPTPPAVAFENLPVRRSEAVKVKVLAPASDPDGDKVTLTWAWSRDGQPQKGFSGPELPANTVRKGERWAVSVVASDGQASSPAVKLETTVQGSAPAAPEIALSPADPKAGDAIKVSLKKADAAGAERPRVRYRFLVDGTPMAEGTDSDTLPAFSARKKQTVVVEAVALDGEIAGPATTARLTVRNTPPTPPTVTLIPAEPRQGDVLEASLTAPGADEDGDPLTYKFTFLRDGKKVGGSGDGRYLTGLKKGEVCEVEVVASDGEAESAPARAKATVRNSAPSAPAVAFEALPIHRSDPVRVKVLAPATDPDGDKLTLTWAWSRDGQPQKGFSGPELPANTVRKGEKWAVSVTATDGQASSSPIKLEAVVAGSAPGVPEVALTPAEPKAGDAIRAQIKKDASDADGDKLRYQFRFLVDGTPVPEGPEPGVLPAFSARRRQVVTVEAVAADGELTGPAAVAKVTVGNTAPSAPAVALLPADPRRGDALLAALTAPGADPDGDPLSYRFTFLKDGKKVAAGAEGRLLAGARKGETYEVEVVATDGEAESAPARAKVSVGNSLPSGPAVSFANDSPKTGEAVEVKLERPAVDPDGDSVSYQYAFAVDGKPAGLAKDARSIPSGKLKKGQVWTVEVSGSDGQGSGPVGRARLVVANTPPSAAKVVIEPAEPSATTGAKATLAEAASDRDGDSLRYRYAWYRDGVKLDLPEDAASLPPERLRGARALRLVAAAFDGEAEGPAATAMARVKNSAPTAPELSLRPERPGVGDAVSCAVDRPSTDADGNEPTLRFAWRINGEPVPMGSAESMLPAGVARRGDTVTCEVTATDGELSASPVKAEVKIVNSPPAAPSAVIEPENPRAGQDLRCRLTKVAEDPDGDRMSYSFRWFESGKELKVESKESGVLPSSMLRKGVTYRCEVVASDGESSAAPVAAEGAYRNSPPRRPVVRMTPATPVAGSTLTCEIAEESVDPDGDPVRYKYLWHKNGAEQPFASSSAQVPGRLVKAGDVWRCAVTPHDDELEGTRAVSDELEVGKEAAASR